jgi:hypothetical protein
MNSTIHILSLLSQPAVLNAGPRLTVSVLSAFPSHGQSNQHPVLSSIQQWSQDTQSFIRTIRAWQKYAWPRTHSAGHPIKSKSEWVMNCTSNAHTLKANMVNVMSKIRQLVHPLQPKDCAVKIDFSHWIVQNYYFMLRYQHSRNVGIFHLKTDI